MLIAELDEAFSKNTGAHRHEPRGPEMTAWRRAAAFLDGGTGDDRLAAGGRVPRRRRVLRLPAARNLAIT